MAQDHSELELECDGTIEHFKRELGRMRTGRASPGLLEGLMVDYYGAQTPLIQLGMINVPEPRLITVQVYDMGAAENIEKAIRATDLGLNPVRDKNLIRVAFPALTEERRKEIVKKLHKLAEETKVSVRNHRRDAVDNIKAREKKGDFSQDDLRRGMDEIQKITDKFVAEVDVLLQKKEKEVMEV